MASGGRRTNRGHDICAYGVEALSVPLERATSVITNQRDGRTADFGKMVSACKADLIGTPSERACWSGGLDDPNRHRLVGIVPLDPKMAFRSSLNILETCAAAALENDQGYVISNCASPDRL